MEGSGPGGHRDTRWVGMLLSALDIRYHDKNRGAEGDRGERKRGEKQRGEKQRGERCKA